MKVVQMSWAMPPYVDSGPAVCSPSNQRRNSSCTIRLTSTTLLAAFRRGMMVTITKSRISETSRRPSAMNAHARINWDLVDQFQQRFGWERTFKRARHFMAAYICQIRRPLPPLAAQGWGIAKRFLFFAKKFEDHSDCASSLIEQHFSSKQYSD